MSLDAARRLTRVGERVRTELMQLLLRGSVRDPGVEGVFISDVRMSKDLRYARIYVRLTGCQTSDHERLNTIRALTRASGFLRRELAPRLKLRNVPELKFVWDEQVDRALRIDTLLEEIRREKEQ
ncbi:MAG: 30S ribosome-binding factor RbfA [Deltaproteobacteria bacterium]|nr:30S ribosome-binding factor RbfA [Deltaproteobacteria bacterium]